MDLSGLSARQLVRAIVVVEGYIHEATRLAAASNGQECSVQPDGQKAGGQENNVENMFSIPIK
jgi:hypothetical protein